MKIQFKIFSYITFIIIVSSCASTNRMTMGVTELAILHITSDVKIIGIFNRILPSKANTILDKVLSAEVLNLDKKGSEPTISSLSSELSVIKEFEEIKIIEDIEEIRKGLNLFPAALS